MKYEVNKYVENKIVKRTMWFDTGGVWRQDRYVSANSK